MSRKTRKQLVELEINEDLAQWERDTQCRELQQELRQQWRAQMRALAESRQVVDLHEDVYSFLSAA